MSAGNPDESKYRVHRCGFVSLTLSPVTCLGFSPASSSPYLAVGRGNGDIELWNVMEDWNQERVIVGGGAMSVVALAWSAQGSATWLRKQVGVLDPLDKIIQTGQDNVTPARLFSAGTDGFVVEWDLDRLVAKSRVSSDGGAVQSMAASHNGTMLAIGCEDRSIRLLLVEEAGFSHSRVFDRQDGRLLSLAWSVDDQQLVSGSSNGLIRVWNVAKRQTVQRISVDEEGRAHVWSVTWLVDGTVVSGDSTGRTQFWDGGNGTLVRSFSSHTSDVLAVASSLDGARVYSAGADGRILQFQYSGDSASWSETGHRRVHTGGIRALAVPCHSFLPAVVSAGLDARLMVHHTPSFPARLERRLPLVPTTPAVKLAADRGTILVRHDTVCQVWSAAAVGGAEPGRLMFEIRLGQAHNVSVSAISSNGDLVAVSTRTRCRVFSQSSGAWTQMEHRFPASRLAAFSHDCKSLVLVTMDQEICVYSVYEEVRLLRSTKHVSTVGRSAFIVSISLSRDDKYLALATLQECHIYSLHDLKQTSAPPNYARTCIQLVWFHPVLDLLAIVSAGNSFHLYNVKHKRLDRWSGEHSDYLPKEWMRQKDKVVGMDVDRDRPEQIVLWGQDLVARFDISRVPSPDDPQMTRMYRSLLLFGFLRGPDTQLCVVESKHHS